MKVSFKRVVMFFFFFALVASAGVIQKEITFDKSDISFSKIDNYDFIRLKGCESTVEIGAPSLPRASFSLLIPQGAEVIDVEVVSLDKEVITGEYDIYPTQHPQPFLKGKVFPFVEPDKNIYTQSTPYPEKIIESSHTGSMGGYRIASLLVYPIQYVPSEKQLIFHSRIEFRVTYKENLRTLDIKKTEKQIEIFGERVEKLVLNPEDIGMSEPSIGLSKSLALSPDTVEYVIITAASLKAPFQELADWKTKKGIPARVVTLDSIYANYTGVDDAEKVRNFIKDANSSWGTIWVLLGGQCDYEWGQEIVPRRNVYYITSYGGNYPDEDTIPSDLYFSDLDGNWNADGDGVFGESSDGVDLYSDVFVGRAPVLNVTQAEIFVDKVLTYEKSPPIGYQKKILLPAAYLWPGLYDERTSQEAIANIVPSGWQVTKMYERNGNLVHSTFVDSVRSGFGFAHLVGHGNEYGVYTYYGDAYFESDDLDTLGNDSLLGIHNSIGCMCGGLDLVPYGDCFAEHYLTPATGGSYSIMNSRYGWGNPPYMGASEHIDTCFYHEIFKENYLYHDHIGTAHAFSKDGYVSQVTWTDVWAWCIYELNLFGDPEMPLWTNIPEELTVTHDAVIPVGSSSFAVNVTDGISGVEDALVCLYKEGEVYERGYTNASGNITLTLDPSPASLGTMYCTVTKSDYLPYEDSVDVISPSGPWVIFDSYEVLDISGNSDGNVDPGETIELVLTVHNVGLDSAYIISAILRTTDSYVTLTDSTEDFGDIAPDSLAVSLEDFDFGVALGCPVSHVINFELVAKDVNDSIWTSNFSIPVSTPDIALSADSLDFDTVFIGYPDTLELLVNNVGRDTLFVSDITSDNTEFSVDITNFSVPPVSTQTVKVMFAPVAEVLSTGNLTIESNDLDESSLTVFLQGEGLLSPDISVSPDSLDDTLYTGETSTHILKIYNNGASDLDFDILIEELDTSALLVDFFGDKSVRKHKVVAFGRPVPLDELSNEEFSFFPQTTEVSNDFIDKGKPFDNNPSSIKPLGIGEEVFGNDDNVFYAGPRSRGNLFTCDKSTTLVEHRLYINPSASTELWFLVYEGESQVGTYNLISASDVTPAGPGLGWYSSGKVDVPLVEGKYYLIIASFEEPSNYYNQQGIFPYPIPASFGALTAGAGWDWAPSSVFPPSPTQSVPSSAFGDPVAYYQTLVTGRWLDCDTTEGRISGGDSVLIEVTFDANGLNGGDYYADIIISSNDPDESEVIVPAHLHVTGAPDIAVSEDTLDYGIVYNGYSLTDTLIVTNEGNDLLTVSDISSDNSDYTVDVTNFTLDPDETQEVLVTFTPSTTGTITGTLTITSDDPDEPTVTISLLGESLEPPDIWVSPDSLSDTLFTGETSNHILTIYNTGASDLDFVITIEGGGSTYALEFDGVDDYVEVPDDTSLSAIGGAFTLECWMNVGEYPFQNREVLGKWGPGASSDDEYDIDLLSSGIIKPSISGSSGGYAMIQSSNPISPYTWTHVAVVFDSASTSLKLYINEDLDANITPSTITMDRNTAQPFRMGTYDFSFYSNFKGQLDEVRIWNVARTEGEIQANMHRELSGSEPGLVGYWKFNEGSGDTAYGSSPNNNDGLLLGGVAWVVSSSPVISWIYVDTISGTIPALDSAKIEVTFDATGLYGGDYYADIIIASNDPDEPELVVPAHLHVIGMPDIAVSADTLDCGIVYPGSSVTDTLIVANEGTDSLTVSDISSDNSDYTVDITNFTLNPGETQEVEVTFTPSTTGTITGALTITSNDPDESPLIVALLGECLEPPDISVSPDSLSDTLNQGETATHWLTISNTGVSDLNFDILIEGEGITSLLSAQKSISADIEKQVVTLVEIAKGEEDPRVYPPKVIGKGGPDQFGYRWKDSDEPDGPTFNWIDVSSGTSISLSDDDFATGIPLGFTFSYYGTDYTTIGVGSNGWLSFNGSDDWYPSNVPAVDYYDGAIAPFARDLYPPSASYIRYKTFGTAPNRYFVVEYNNIPDYSGGNNKTFEIIFYESYEKIRFQYLVAPNDPYGFGIESPDETMGMGNAGLDSLFISPTVVKNNYAIEFSLLPDWLRVDPISGTVPADSTVNIEVTFDATGLAVGDYFADIVITSNDPDEPEVRVPAHLHVRGAGIEEIEIPKVFSISQNYPNPFNRQTVIRYACPEPSEIKIQIFDIMGRLVTTLVNREVEAGYHEVIWNGCTNEGKKVANSVYFYRMQTEGNCTPIKKMVLLQ
jgi:hypothetical protein